MGSSTSRNDRKDEEEIRARDAIDLAEKGLSDDRLYQLQVAAIKCLKENDLRKLIKHMESIVIEKKIAEKKRRKQEQLSISDYLGVANIKVFKDVKMIVADKKSEKENALKTEWVKEEIELKWSDRFWLFFLKNYAKVMESMIPLGRRHRVGLTGIPVGGNAIQMFFTPIIMVGIPKWIRCPPSVLYSLWWTWLTFTLTAYIPFWGTYRFARRAPITEASSKLSTYLLLRKLLSDSHLLRKGEKGYDRRKRLVVSRHLSEYLGDEVTYPLSMDKDISGKWGSCCSCFW